MSKKRRILYILALGHATVDLYSNFPTPLLPLLVTKFDLSVSAVGALISILSISNSLSQLLYGYLSDRMRRSLFVIFGPVVAAFFTCSIGFAPTYPILVGCLVIGGIGVAAFHPQAAAGVGRLGGRRRGLAMSTFATAGTVGFAIGPVVATYTVTYFGLERMPVLMIFGLVTSILLWRWMIDVAPEPKERASPGFFRGLDGHRMPFTLLYVVATLRASVSIGFVNFLVLYLKDTGSSLVTIGWMASLFILSGAVGGMVGGYLSDRVGRKTVLLLSTGLAAPFFSLLLSFDGLPFVLLLMLAGFVFSSATPVNVVIAQELLPENISTVSSMIMGAAWGVGGMMVGLYSLAADVYGVAAVLRGLAFMPLFICLFILPFKMKK
jgi:FSR family fosmidomycin resistance protein-like MFS transporter